MEIKNLEEELRGEECSMDNINFSLNCDTIEPIVDNKECIIDYFNQQLIDFFSIRLAYLEESYLRKEVEVTDLMFKLHDITLISNDMKVQLPHPIIFKKKQMNFDSNEEDLNSSKMSTMSRRSNSSTRSSKKDFMQPKNNPRDKMALFSPKVAINIMFNQDKDTNSSSLDKSIIRKNSDGVKSKSMNSGSNVAKQPSREERNANKKLTQSPVNHDKVKNEVENKQGFTKPNATRKVNSDGDNLIKKNQKNLPTTNLTNNAHSNNKVKPVLVKGASNEKNQKYASNQPANKPIYNINSSPKVNHGNKNVGSNYNSSNVPGGNKNILDKNDKNRKNNNEMTKNMDIFNNQNLKSNYKFEPKAIKNQINLNNINNNTSKSDEEKKNSLSSSRGKSINEKMDSNISKRILKFLQLQEKINFKNVNQKFRKLFFADEIQELSNRIMLKKLEENPCYFMVIPKSLEDSAKERLLILSNYTEKYMENPSFNNLINILYTITFTGDITISKDNFIKQKFLFQKIEDLEQYVFKNGKSSSVYSVFPYLISNLKLKNEVYVAIKELYYENEQAFNLRGLTEEFKPFTEFLDIISKCINNGTNMEIQIDLEILQHKLEILKTYSDQK